MDNSIGQTQTTAGDRNRGKESPNAKHEETRDYFHYVLTETKREEKKNF